MNKTEIEINGEQYYIVRTYSAGVFAGYIESRNGHETVMRNARRIWKWAGAASLSQLAMEGTSDPDNCKFPCEVSRIILLNTIEIIEATEAAKKSIQEVAIWKA
jgi:hypothetical protein